jgi:hypothetical protein
MEIPRRSALSGDCVRERGVPGVVYWMLNSSPVSVSTFPAFIKGQLWKYGDRCLRIEHVGKRLVEHRGVSLETNRNVSFKRMANMNELRTFLTENNAVLMA